MSTALKKIQAVDAKYTGYEPDWTEWQSMTPEQFWLEHTRAIKFYNYYCSAGDLKPAVLEWMKNHGYTPESIAAVKATPDWSPGIYVATLCHLLNRGMPDLHPGLVEYLTERVGPDTKVYPESDHIRPALEESITLGMIELDLRSKAAQSATPAVSPMEHLQRKVKSTILPELNDLIDSWAAGREVVAYPIYDKMREHELPAAACNQVREFINSYAIDITLALAGDEDAIETFRFLSKKQLKLWDTALQQMISDLDKFGHAKRAQRKPRVKKAKSAEKQVGQLKYCKADTSLKLGSINPLKIPGVYRLLAYNVKKKVFFEYIAQSVTGLEIKGTSLRNICKLSSRCLRLRKPQEFLEIALNSTAKQLDKAIGKLTTKPRIPNSRINEDTVLLRVFQNKD